MTKKLMLSNDVIAIDVNRKYSGREVLQLLRSVVESKERDTNFTIQRIRDMYIKTTRVVMILDKVFTLAATVNNSKQLIQQLTDYGQVIGCADLPDLIGKITGNTDALLSAYNTSAGQELSEELVDLIADAQRARAGLKILHNTGDPGPLREAARTLPEIAAMLGTLKEHKPGRKPRKKAYTVAIADKVSDFVEEGYSKEHAARLAVQFLTDEGATRSKIQIEAGKKIIPMANPIESAVKHYDDVYKK